MAGQRYLYLEQTGEGCDYSIGCGEKLFELNEDARNVEAQVAAVFDQVGVGYEGREIRRAVVLEIVQDMMPLYRARETRLREEVVTAAHAYKKEELARLKKELGEA